MNTINLIKGFAFALFGYLGIHINIEAKMLHIMVKEGSISWYLLEIITQTNDNKIKNGSTN